MPRLVEGRFFTVILNTNSSDSTCHFTPNALSTGRATSLLRSIFLIPAPPNCYFGHGTFVRKTIQPLEEFLLTDFDNSLSNTEKLRAWKITLDGKKNTLNKLDDAILEDTAPKKIEEEINEASEFAEHINRAIVRTDVALETIKKRTTDTEVGSNNLSSVTSNPNPSTVSTNTSDSMPKLQAKLPKLTLERFSGEPTKWQSFWDSFESAMHDNKNVAAVDKFNYLKGLFASPTQSY